MKSETRFDSNQIRTLARGMKMRNNCTLFAYLVGDDVRTWEMLEGKNLVHGSLGTGTVEKVFQCTSSGNIQIMVHFPAPYYNLDPGTYEFSIIEFRRVEHPTLVGMEVPSAFMAPINDFWERVRSERQALEDRSKRKAAAAKAKLATRTRLHDEYAIKFIEICEQRNVSIVLDSEIKQLL